MKEFYFFMRRNVISFSFLLSAFCFLPSAKAQVAEFDFNGAKSVYQQVPTAVVAMGDYSVLEIRVPLLNKNVASPYIYITLPKGVNFGQVTAGSTTKAAIIMNDTEDPTLTPYAAFSTANPVLTGSEATGDRTCRIQYVANGNTFFAYDTLKMKIFISATCNVDMTNPGSFIVDIRSGTKEAPAEFILGYKELKANVLKPSMAMNYYLQAPIKTQPLDTNNVVLDLTATNGYVNSTLITLGAYAGNVILLEDFKIDGVPLTLLNSNSGIGVYHSSRVSASDPRPLPTATSQTTTIRLDQTVLNGKIAGTPRKLTFRAIANLGCIRYIASKIQNNLASACETWTGDQIMLPIEGNDAAPLFNVDERTMRMVPRFNLLDPTDLTIPNDPYVNNWHYACWDGNTPVYGNAVYTNTNGTPTTAFTTSYFAYYGTTIMPFHYIDTTQVYFRVTVKSKINGSDSLVVPVTRIPGNYITYSNNLLNNNPAIFSPILWNKSTGITIKLPISKTNYLPDFCKIEVQYAMYGNPDWVVDAYRAKKSFNATSSNYNDISFGAQNITAENLCGYSVVTSTGNLYASVLYLPRFAAPAQERITLYPNQSYTYSNYLTTGNATAPNTTNSSAVNNPALLPTGPRYAECFIKMPSWLRLDSVGTIESAFNHGGTAPMAGSGVDHGTADGYRTYSVKFFTNTGALLNVKLKPEDCTCNCVTADTMQVWVDWVSGTGSAGCRPTFKKITKTYSVVEYNCIQPALVIEDLGVFRETRGLRDVIGGANGDHAPDDGTLALDEDIVHNRFRVYDTGYYYIRGYVGGNAANTYENLIAIIKYVTGGPIVATRQWYFGNAAATSDNNANGPHTVPLWNNATITFKKVLDNSVATLPLNIPQFTRLDSLVVYYEGNVQDYTPHGGDSVLIKIPFRVQSSYNIELGAYIGRSYGTKAGAPNDWVGFYAYSAMQPIYFMPYYLQAGGNVVSNFTAACQIVNTNPYLYHPSSGAGIDFPKEVRSVNAYRQAVARIPAGYLRTSNTFGIYLVKWYNLIYTPTFTIPSANYPNIITSVVEDYATKDSIFTIDLTQIFDYNYDGSNPDYKLDPASGQVYYLGAPQNPPKYAMGDDQSGVFFTIPLMSTPAAATSSTFNTTFSHIPYFQTGMVNTVCTRTLNYSGPRVFIAALPNYVLVTAQQLSFNVNLQSYTANSPNKSVWLYLQGSNVENAKLVDPDSKATLVPGQGLNKCWLYVGDMAHNRIDNYALVFSYKEKTECTNDTITLYTVFDPNKVGFMPDVSKSIDEVPLCYRGTKRSTILDVVTPKVKVAGSVSSSIPNPLRPNYLHHQSVYTVDFKLNGMVSQGALADPYIVVYVPKGQVYVDTTSFGATGVAQYQYPNNSGWQDIPPALHNRLMASIGMLSGDPQGLTARYDTIYLKDVVGQNPFMLPGWGAVNPIFGFTDNDRVFTIRIPLVPTCETELTGLRYRGTFHGKSVCNARCEDDGMTFIAPTILTDVEPEYNFDVTVANIESRTFVPDKIIDTVVGTFTKAMGAHIQLINAGDYVQLTLPSSIQLNGQITCPQFGGLNIGIQGTSVGSFGENVYRLDLPITQLNNLYPFRDDSTFYYLIPVIYTPAPNFSCDAPRQLFGLQVVTMANFNPAVCTSQPISIGNAEQLTLNINLENKTACINMPVSVTISCPGVTPVWFAYKGSPVQLAVGNTFTYTPTVQKDTTLWIQAVWDYGGDTQENFGWAPVKIFMYPEVIADFNATAVCVGDTTRFTNLSTVGGVPSVMGGASPNTVKWYWYVNGATVPFDSVQNPKAKLAAGDIVKLRVISTDGCVREISKPITLYPLPVPAITGSWDECFKDCAYYHTEPGMTNYVWSATNGTVQAPTGEDSVKVCWDIAYSPTRGKVAVLYTDRNGCRAAVPTESGDVVIRALPETPVITGATTPCVSTEKTYTFVPQGITISDYIWTVPAEGTITDGGALTDDYVKVMWNTPGAHKITLNIVRAGTGCRPENPGELLVTVQGPPPPTITGTNSLCIDGAAYPYKTETGMFNYAWYIEGGTITSGGASNQITVNWNTYGTGKLAVSYDDGSCTTFMTDTFKVAIIPCQIVQCALLTNRVVTEDGVGVGYYTQLNTSWDALPVTGITFDSVRYYINGILVSNGPAATLNGTQFPARMTHEVMCVPFYNGKSDTCEFTVTVVRACPPTISDEEGNPYKVTSLAGECWTSNLKTTLYPGTTTPIPFANPYTCAGCPAGLDAIFGLLYTWYSAVNLPDGTTAAAAGVVQGICPNGWHIPSKAEWSLLDAYSPKQLKSVDYWLTTAGNGTDDFGFAALPAGKYNSQTGRYVDLYGFAGWWASDSEVSQTANYFEIAYYCESMVKTHTLRSDAMSVRCIMD